MGLRGIDIFIAADHSLQEAASLVSSALTVTMSEELTGRFEEFPAYFTEQFGVEYALLGPPEPEHDTRDTPTDEFCLQIFVREVGANEPTREQVIAALRSVGLRPS